jgi:aspartokinase
LTDVLKFGGTSVGTAERIRDVARLVGGRGGDPCVVVVSAMGGVTDELIGLKIASNGKERAGAEAVLETLARRHGAALEGLGLSEEDHAACAAAVDEELRRARVLSTGISLLEEISPRTSDALLSVG